MVETVRLVRICRWTAPQPHEVTRPCEWLGVNKLRGNYTMALNGRLGLRIQPVDATHWVKRSAGVSKLSVSLGRSFSRRATALSLF